jgi:NAD-dependent DNA ligase
MLLALLSLPFVACDNTTVSRAEYDALLKEKQELEAENDSLYFELSSLKIYVECLEEDNDELAEELKRTTGDQR